MYLFDIPQPLMFALPFLSALSLAVIAYVLIEPVVSKAFRSRNADRLDGMAGAGQTVAASREHTGSKKHRIRLAFRQFGLDAAGKEDFYVIAASALLGAGIFIVLMIVGLPPFSALVGFIMAYVFVEGWIGQSWSKIKSDVENEIPTFLNALASTLQIAPNVPAGIERVADTLSPSSSLREWVIGLASSMMAKGVPAAIKEAMPEAEAFSPSLVVVLALIDRMHQTGGTGYGKAFVAAAENMESVLDARVNARAQGSGERGVMYFLMIAAIALSAISLRNEALADVVSSPLVQIMYAVIFLGMTYGLTVINDIIDSVV